MTPDDPLAAAGRHPALEGLAHSAPEAQRLARFTHDLARWLHGAPRAELGALARVVTLVAQRELRDARQLCHDRPLLAVESAARASAALWPLLREQSPAGGAADEDEDDQEDEEEEDQGAGGGGASPDDGEDGEDEDEGGADGDDDAATQGGAGAGSSGSDAAFSAAPGGGAGSEAGPEATGDPAATPLELLARLADLDTLDDPELDALAARLAEAREAHQADLGAAAGELLAGVGQHASDAALRADRAARHLERFLPGVGWSDAPGALERSLLDQLDGLTELLARLDELSELADRLGRLEDPTTERGLVEGGREEVVGVTMSGEVATALPSELALLADPDTEDLFYQRMIEHRLVSLELTGAGDQGAAQGDRRGPVIACIDTSGSMEGAPELAAKALVLAVCRRVLPRNRTVHLILFGGPEQRTELRLRRGRGGLQPLLAFLLAGFHAGTDFDGPLLRAMDLLEEQDLQRADILVVTDGLCRATAEVVQRVVAVRDAHGARVWSVVLGRADPRGVEPFSHEVLALDPTAAASATGLLKRL